jgi:hypothetical protein
MTGKLTIGANSAPFAAIRTVVPALAGCRIYHPGVNDWPVSWPELPGTATVSIRPALTDLMAGKLDSSLLAFIDSAPPGARLTIWHEAGNLPEYDGYAWMTPQAMTAAHEHMARLCAGSSVSYGPVLCMHPDSMPPWMPGGMGWYGLDIYDWPEFHLGRYASKLLDMASVTARLEQWRLVVIGQAGANPDLVIAETNSPRPADRPTWFRAAGDWLAGHGASTLLTFWKADGCGPWLPGDAAVIEALNYLAGLEVAS